MVLRALILILLLCSISFAAPAKGKKAHTSVYKRAYSLYEQGHYDRALDEIDRVLNSRQSRNVPDNFLFLAAAIYQKTGQYERALRFIDSIIQRQFQRQNQIVQRNFNPSAISGLDEEVPNGLVLLYLLKSTIFNAQLLHHLEEFTEEQREHYFNFIKTSAELAFTTAYKEDYADKLLASVNKIEKEYRDSVFTKNYYVGLHYFTWRDEITLKSASGSEFKVRTTNSGLGTVVGKRWANAKREYTLFGALALADATVGNDNPVVNYFQSGVSTKLVQVGGGAYYRPNAGGVAIGAELACLYRTGDYEDPPGAATIEDTSLLSVGAFVGLKWKISEIEFQLRMGKVLGMPSSAANFGLGYHF